MERKDREVRDKAIEKLSEFLRKGKEVKDRDLSRVVEGVKVTV